MRTRNLKPGFFKNDILGFMDPLCRILFSGLWCLADREGKLEDRPLRIKAEILPFDNCDCDKMLDELFEKGFIIRYEASKERYIKIKNFQKHQHPNIKETVSVIPSPCEESGEAEKKDLKSASKGDAEDENDDGKGEDKGNKKGEENLIQNKNTKKHVKKSESTCFNETDTSLNPKPYTLNPIPYTSNPIPYTPDEKTKKEAEEILSYFEKKRNMHLKDRKSQLKVIYDAFERGFVKADMITVIDKMIDEWEGTKYEKFLRIRTLFGDKMEDYLQRKVYEEKGGQNGNEKGVSGKKDGQRNLRFTSYSNNNNYSDEDIEKLMKAPPEINSG